MVFNKGYLTRLYFYYNVNKVACLFLEVLIKKESLLWAFLTIFFLIVLASNTQAGGQRSVGSLSLLDFTGSPTAFTFLPIVHRLEPSLTPTPSDTPEPVTRFAVIGDYGLAGQPEADVAALVLSWSPDFVITTGDNNYPDGSAQTIDENIGQYYHSFIYPYFGNYGEGADINRFFPSVGNHDWRATNGQPYLDYFTLPGNERYYDFTWGPLHLFSINSDQNEPDGMDPSSVQAAWLQQKLAASTSPWQIVYTHYAPYSSGTYGVNTWIQWPFKEWGVDAVLSGHEHSYERLLIKDLVYFVNGAGGGSLYNFRNPIQGSMVRFNSDYGAMLAEVTREKIVFWFFTRQKVLIDEFTLMSGSQ